MLRAALGSLATRSAWMSKHLVGWGLLLHGASVTGAPAQETDAGQEAVEVHGRLFLDFPLEDAESRQPRSARLQLRHHVTDRFSLRGQWEFSKYEVETFEAYAEWNDPALGQFRVGHLREPAGAEARTGLSFLPCPERSAASRALLPQRNAGVTWRSPDGDGLSFSAVRGNDRAFEPLTTEQALTARFDLRLRRSLHVGTWGMVREGGEDGLQFRTRPLGVRSPALLDTGILPGAEARGIGLEVSHWRRGFVLQAEWMHQQLVQAGTASGVLWGWVVTLLLPSRGLDRTWREERQTLGWAIPDRVGAHEWVLRGSGVDLGAAGRCVELTAGINWAWSKRSRTMLHLQRTFLDAGPDFDALLLRVQVGF